MASIPSARPTTSRARASPRLQLQRLRSIVDAGLRARRLLPQADGVARPHAGLDPEARGSRRSCPFTVKTDLRDTYPFGLVRQPDGGDRPAARLLRHDRQADRRGLHAGRPRGLDEGDGAHLRLPAGCTAATSCRTPTATACSPAGSGAHYGAEALGATVIPISGGNTERQIMVMQDFGVTAICCTPSLLPPPRRARAGDGHRLRDCRCASASSAPSRGARRCASASRRTRGIRAYDIYGLSEIIGPGRGARNARTRPGCTSSRTTSIRRSSIP